VTLFEGFRGCDCQDRIQLLDKPAIVVFVDIRNQLSVSRSSSLNSGKPPFRIRRVSWGLNSVGWAALRAG
jgi:hypothetical protein